MKITNQIISIKDIIKASEVIKDVSIKTPLIKNINLSNQFDANIYLKREDLQQVRSYKIRGAFNKISSLNKEQLKRGLVCASAGNHAQGFAFSCFNKKVYGTIFIPTPTPLIKINQVKKFGDSFVKIILIGDTFDDTYKAAYDYSLINNLTFIHPFDDIKTIEGQATIGLEILEDFNGEIDYVILPVGGGGVASGISTVFKHLSPHTKIIGVELL